MYKKHPDYKSPKQRIIDQGLVPCSKCIWSPEGRVIKMCDEHQKLKKILKTFRNENV